MAARRSASGPRSGTDTTPERRTLADIKRARTGRRVLLAVFGTFQLLGALGVLGDRKGEVSATGGGYTLSVTYPRVTRPGHAVPLEIEVRRTGGFGDEPVVISMRAGYFALFDENGMVPGPAAETATGEDVVWEFDPPPGDVLRVLFDTRTGPNRQRGEPGTVAVLVDDTRVVSVSFRTRVMP